MKECIASAGGWEHDTLTEDLDLRKKKLEEILYDCNRFESKIAIAIIAKLKTFICIT